MPDPPPTPNCPDPGAADFLRCLKTWELMALNPGIPYAVISRSVDNLGNVDAARLAKDTKRYRNRAPARNLNNFTTKERI